MVRRISSLLVLALLVGCGLAQRTVAAPPPAPATIHDGWPGCTTTAPDAEGAERPRYEPGGIPVGFGPTRAVLCDSGERTAKNGDVVQVQLERTATDIGPLLDYLRRPSEVAVHPNRITCPAILIPEPVLFLLDGGGRWIDVQVPIDACRFPLDAMTEAGPPYRNLSYTDRVVRILGVDETAAARQAGCSMQWKYVIAVEAVDASPVAITADPWPTGTLRRCRYDVPEEERGTDAPGGNFTAGGALTPAADAAVRGALMRSAPAQPCDRSAGSFALLQPADGTEPVVYVELDGCQRVLIEGQPNRLAQADPELVRRLS